MLMLKRLVQGLDEAESVDFEMWRCWREAAVPSIRNGNVRMNTYKMILILIDFKVIEGQG